MTAFAVLAAAFSSACSSEAKDDTALMNRRKARIEREAAQAKLAEEKKEQRKASAKDDALLFVRVAQSACKGLTRKIEDLTPASAVDFAELNSFIPPEIYPSDAFATYVDEATFADVKSQMTQLVASVVELLRTLTRNQATAITGVERPADDLVKDRAAFQERKLKALTSADSYCESVRRAGAGVVPLH
jgi:hypothetical protein